MLPSVPGKGADEGESEISRGKGEKRRAESLKVERSPDDEGQGQGEEAGEEGKP